MKENIHWVDNIKLIGILAVILGHMNSPFSSFIFSWHMPLFFMISGFFLKLDQPVRDFIKKDFHRLMIPYLIFALLGLIVEILKRFVLHRDTLSMTQSLKGIFIEMNFEGLQTHYGFVLWFLPTLFLARLLIYSLYLRQQSHFLSVLVVVGMFALSFWLRLPFAIDHAMNAVLWVWLGYVLFPQYQKQVSVPITAGIVGVVIAYVFFQGIPSLNMAEQYYENIPLNIIFALGMITSMVFTVKNFHRVWMKDWSAQTMLLLVFHPYTNNAAHLIVDQFAADLWILKFLLSLVFLQFLLFLKSKSKDRGVFKYV